MLSFKTSRRYRGGRIRKKPQAFPVQSTKRSQKISWLTRRKLPRYAKIELTPDSLTVGTKKYPMPSEREIVEAAEYLYDRGEKVTVINTIKALRGKGWRFGRIAHIDAVRDKTRATLEKLKREYDESAERRLKAAGRERDEALGFHT